MLHICAQFGTIPVAKTIINYAPELINQPDEMVKNKMVKQHDKREEIGQQNTKKLNHFYFTYFTENGRSLLHQKQQLCFH
jgi:hypothetical protein